MHGCLNLNPLVPYLIAGSVYLGAFADFEVNTRTISTTNFDINPQR
jgi:hypothetical protein